MSFCGIRSVVASSCVTQPLPCPPTGITFLAAGTSIPDAYASLLVSKQGQGDMAIANCFGSNVFDILVGLAVPWLIQTTWIDPSGYSIIFSKGLLYTVVLLFLTIIITVSTTWRLLYHTSVALMTSNFLSPFFSITSNSFRQKRGKIKCIKCFACDWRISEYTHQILNDIHTHIHDVSEVTFESVFLYLCFSYSSSVYFRSLQFTAAAGILPNN